jgi:hypothetical protein
MVSVMVTLPIDIESLQEICRRNDVARLGVFGSIARGEGTEQSDVDMLVEFAGKKSLLDVVKLERELGEALGRKVDLLTEAAISPYLRERILGEVQVIYEAG